METAVSSSRGNARKFASAWTILKNASNIQPDQFQPGARRGARKHHDHFALDSSGRVVQSYAGGREKRRTVFEVAQGRLRTKLKEKSGKERAGDRRARLCDGKPVLIGVAYSDPRFSRDFDA